MLAGDSAFFHNGSAQREAAVDSSLDVARWDSSKKRFNEASIEDQAPPLASLRDPGWAIPRRRQASPDSAGTAGADPEAPQPRYTESPIYPYLETNVDFLPMQFSQELISADKTDLSISLYGAAIPFRHDSVMQRYAQELVNQNGYQDFAEYNTAVERVEGVGGEWKAMFRKGDEHSDYWWVEWFEAVVVASGHYWLPYVPHIDGFEEFERDPPGSVIYSKQHRGSDAFKGKVVVVGASVSAADTVFDSTKSAGAPIQAVVLGHTGNPYIGDEAFNHPLIHKRPSIARVGADTRTMHFVDGTSIASVDHLIFGTGHTWALPFPPQVPVRNNRVPGLYQHLVWRDDPTLLFVGAVGAVGAGLTFMIFEWQAVYAARILAGRGTIPPLEERSRWERERVEEKSVGAKFTTVFPDVEDYLETLPRLVGPPQKGNGRALPPFEKEWE
ncbi:hypothetical protein DL767_003470 [Monosporascus sp. MG133]|nr:hypothetical protein DL767_003470 [Monosporascus sp. MG133]